MKPLIECKNLVLSYEGHTVIDNLSFCVNDGDFLCILGENGSGKSTLVKAILGLKTPTSGEIVRRGYTAKQVGYLPQQTQVQKDFPASVKEVVLSGCASKMGPFKPFFTEKEKANARLHLTRLGAEALESKCFRDLSGGQQQRVLLARALCAAEKILFLDEPAAGLDEEVTKDLYAVTDELNRNNKMTVVMISHDTKEALAHASHILHIGSFLFYGTVDEYATLLAEKGGEERV